MLKGKYRNSIYIELENNISVKPLFPSDTFVEELNDVKRHWRGFTCTFVETQFWPGRLRLFVDSSDVASFLQPDESHTTENRV